MPQFYFHLRTAQSVEWDDTGIPFVDLGAAYLDACRAIPAMVSELLNQGCDPLRCAFEITDERGQNLMDVPFAERLTKAAASSIRTSEAGPSTADLLARLDDLSREAQARAAELRRTIQCCREAGGRAGNVGRPFLDRVAEAYGIDSGGSMRETERKARP